MRKCNLGPACDYKWCMVHRTWKITQLPTAYDTMEPEDPNAIVFVPLDEKSIAELERSWR